MDKSNALTILKHAFLMERKGKSLYETAMNQADDENVKAFFKSLADDEQTHMDILEKQFKSYVNDGRFMAGGFENDAAKTEAPDILDQALKERITDAAGFEATAITAAISFEEKAVQMYAKRAEESEDPEEKKLYHWLSTWEKTHLKKLQDLESSLMEQVWNDNNFWPF